MLMCCTSAVFGVADMNVLSSMFRDVAHPPKGYQLTADRSFDKSSLQILPWQKTFLLNVDWTHSDDEHAAAYSRAGLPQWAAARLSGSGLPTEPASQGAPEPTSAVGPSAVVQATVSDVMLTLPHDQDFGRAERFGELWSKAFGQV